MFSVLWLGVMEKFNLKNIGKHLYLNKKTFKKVSTIQTPPVFSQRKSFRQLSDLVSPINSKGIIDVANYHWCANRSLIGC